MREPPVLQQVDLTQVIHRGRRLTYFAGSDYFRLSWHPRVREAFSATVRECGPSACASRMTTGNLPVYSALEGDLTRFFDVETVLLTSSGYLAPLVAAQAVAPEHTTVLLDERAHACLVDAAVLTGLPVRHFRHRDPISLRDALRGGGRKVRTLVLTDGLFTHSGEIAPLADYQEILPPSATLLVDDAHGVGVLGNRGRGTVERCGLSLRRLIVTGTLSKGFGCYGGMILGSRQLRDQVMRRSRIFTGNTAVPPPCAGAARAATEVLRSEGRLRRARLMAHVERIKEQIRAGGGAVGDGPGPMFSLSPGSPAGVRRLSRSLLAAGIYPPLIAYPNGPASRYFRFAISSEHSPEQVTRLAEVLRDFHRHTR